MGEYILTLILGSQYYPAIEVDKNAIKKKKKKTIELISQINIEIKILKILTIIQKEINIVIYN